MNIVVDKKVDMKCPEHNLLSQLMTRASIGFGLPTLFISIASSFTADRDFMPKAAQVETPLGALVELIVAVGMGSAATLACISSIC
jgi:hypothetical protein